MKLSTGPGNIYPNNQTVIADFIAVDTNVNAYYQFFECLNKANYNKLIFYFGKNVTGSAQQTAYLGYYPYNLTEINPSIFFI